MKIIEYFSNYAILIFYYSHFLINLKYILEIIIIDIKLTILANQIPKIILLGF